MGGARMALTYGFCRLLCRRRGPGPESRIPQRVGTPLLSPSSTEGTRLSVMDRSGLGGTAVSRRTDRWKSRWWRTADLKLERGNRSRRSRSGRADPDGLSRPGYTDQLRSPATHASPSPPTLLAEERHDLFGSILYLQSDAAGFEAPVLVHQIGDALPVGMGDLTHIQDQSADSPADIQLRHLNQGLQVGNGQSPLQQDSSWDFGCPRSYKGDWPTYGPPPS